MTANCHYYEAACFIDNQLTSYKYLERVSYGQATLTFYQVVNTTANSINLCLSVTLYFSNFFGRDRRVFYKGTCNGYCKQVILIADLHP